MLEQMKWSVVVSGMLGAALAATGCGGHSSSGSRTADVPICTGRMLRLEPRLKVIGADVHAVVAVALRVPACRLVGVTGFPVSGRLSDERGAITLPRNSGLLPLGSSFGSDNPNTVWTGGRSWETTAVSPLKKWCALGGHRYTLTVRIANSPAAATSQTLCH
jgi:hypothetical protein